MEGRPPENDLSYRDKLPKPGHTGDQYADATGEFPPSDGPSFAEEVARRRLQTEPTDSLDETG